VLTVVFLCHPESWVGKGRPRTHVIGSSARLGTVPQRLLSVARAFLERYGVDVDIDAVGSSDHPADVLSKRAAEIAARMLVMGAFGHRGIREVLFGLSTRRRFDAAPPLTTGAARFSEASAHLNSTALLSWRRFHGPCTGLQLFRSRSRV
jgi:hypothetical protein